VPQAGGYNIYETALAEGAGAIFVYPILVFKLAWSFAFRIWNLAAVSGRRRGCYLAEWQGLNAEARKNDDRTRFKQPALSVSQTGFNAALVPGASAKEATE